MAQKVNIILVDDIDGSDASETVSFGLDGTSYEIDLTEAHALELRETMAGYVGNARKVSGQRRAGARKSTAAAGASLGPTAREVRDWARSNGFTVPDRGRIPGEVREAFEAR